MASRAWRRQYACSRRSQGSAPRRRTKAGSMTADRSPMLPGRLGSPAMLPKDDPRADPRMIAALLPLGLAGAPEPTPVDADSPLDELLEYVGMAEAGYEEMFAAFATGLPPIDGVTSRVEVIEGVDGNDVTLF